MSSQTLPTNDLRRGRFQARRVFVKLWTFIIFATSWEFYNYINLSVKVNNFQ